MTTLRKRTQWKKKLFNNFFLSHIRSQTGASCFGWLFSAMLSVDELLLYCHRCEGSSSAAHNWYRTWRSFSSRCRLLLKVHLVYAHKLVLWTFCFVFMCFHILSLFRQTCVSLWIPHQTLHLTSLLLSLSIFAQVMCLEGKSVKKQMWLPRGLHWHVNRRLTERVRNAAGCSAVELVNHWSD